MQINRIFHESLPENWLGFSVRFSFPFFLLSILDQSTCVSGQTATDVARANGYPNIVDVLENCVEMTRIDTMASNSNVHAAALSNTQFDVCNVVHSMSIVNDANVDRETRLVVAIKGKNLEEVKLLLECGTAAEKADKDGKTFLVVLLSCFKPS